MVRVMDPAGPLDSLDHRSLAVQASEAILNLILEGELAVGDSLPSSTELARRFGVSVVVIREAMASLAGRGILTRRQGRESVVAVPGYDVLSSVLRLQAHHENIGVDDFLACRASLEVEAAASAASAPPDPDADARLVSALEGMTAARTAADFNEHDLTFHLRLAELGGNPAVTLILGALHDVIRSTLQVTYGRAMQRGGAQAILAALEVHRRVTEAVLARDPDAARACMREHFEFSSAVSG
jgi:GntR family transcriptional repressor for pyruvate dehydrogenase complex